MNSIMKEDWIEVELGEVLEIERGGSPRPIKEFITDDEDGINWIKIGDTKGISKYINKTEQKIKPTGLKHSREVYPNDFILSNSMSFGRPYIMGINGAIHDGWLVLRDNYDLLNKDFLYYILSSPNVYSQFDKLATGSTVKNLNIGLVQKVRINFIPKPEQFAIANKIEALFSDLDNGIANFKKAQEQLKIYRQAVLKKAFEGELTKEWREKQTHLPTAEELLKQIKEERQNHYNQQMENWKKAVKEWEKNGKKDDKPRKPTKTKEFPPLNQSEMNELPREWMWVNWSDILDYNDGAFKRGPFGSSLTKSIFVQSGYKVYEQYCPINDDCSFERYYITEEKFKELNSFSVKQGDFLISCSGVTLGRITQIPEKFKEGVINQALLRLRINRDFIDDAFFKFYFRSPFFQKQIFDNSTGSAIPNIKGVNELKVIPVPLLTKAEQKQIIQEIEFRLSVCDKMEQSITESIEKAEALRQSILKKAFEGKLLSEAEIAQCKQAADYEPASELLKKIQAEKLAKELEKKKPTIKKKSKK